LNIRNKFICYGEGLLAARSTSKLEDHPLPFVRCWLFNIYAATLHSWRPPPSASWGRAMLWCQGSSQYS
jgi:hypothetical protein